jgi:hypothetical protein
MLSATATDNSLPPHASAQFRAHHFAPPDAEIRAPRRPSNHLGIPLRSSLLHSISTNLLTNLYQNNRISTRSQGNAQLHG